ncbi:hypothetical protein N474_06475 [Pseudoalteromonas luteoviolacea CPMOR-2]|uniref:Uncharacterized protein n=2 Tax=Pseudoalteromonas luteoviolacea TaxID=43657 RepID=A0A166YEA2_9GAMM|nr:hypothetical protein N475_09475 [Pseudoalteromonas luteoviolacea DSM 6061]KZN60036.1 hypothetical protein N474_06475 [Pseudoalteromonas luteoviolacea CPMOR-2]MBE0385260.1 hypothetical protein [Pseudoalteromonas luteoviolacea DSM 6061]
MYRKWIVCFFALSMAVFAFSHLMLNLAESKDEEITRLIEQSSRHYKPHSTHYLKLVELSSHLSDEQTLSLRQVGYSHFAIEWALRLIKRQQHTQAWLLIEHHWADVDEPIKIRVLELLSQQRRYSFITKIFKQFVAIEPYQTIGQLAQGIDPSMINHRVLSELGINTLDTPLQVQNGCPHMILLLGGTLDSVIKLQQIKAQFQASELASRLPYCFSEPVYVGNSVACDGEKGEFIRCNLAQVVHAQQLFTARHVVMMSDQPGLANVRHGMMVLNHLHGFELFVHELMHFAHFEDEYPVPVEKASWLCASPGLKAPNLYVGNVPPKGWHSSKTCRLGKLRSYKPSHMHSKMEYHAINLSNQYLGLWLKALEQSLLEPSDYQIYHHQLVNARPALVK